MDAPATTTTDAEGPERSGSHLQRALSHFWAKLDRALPLAQRAQNFWAVAVAVRDLAAADVLRDELTSFARSTLSAGPTLWGEAPSRIITSGAITTRLGARPG